MKNVTKFEIVKTFYVATPLCGYGARVFTAFHVKKNNKDGKRTRGLLASFGFRQYSRPVLYSIRRLKPAQR